MSDEIQDLFGELRPMLHQERAYQPPFEDRFYDT